MQSVKPHVCLVARTGISVSEMHEYLADAGGADWLGMRADDPGDATAASDLTEFGGRLCYKSWTEGLNPNVTRIRKDHAAYIANIIASGHGSVLEHASFSLALGNVSRVLTHELVRHRAGVAISQESLRYVRLTEIPFWFPEWAEDDAELTARSADILQALEAHQAWMTEHFGLDDPGVPFAEKKHTTSFMRRFLPDGTATQILLTANARALRHIITVRTEPHAEEEIRLVAGMIAELMTAEEPLLFGDFRQQDDGSWVPRHRKV